jgi:hypothetical protein
LQALPQRLVLLVRLALLPRVLRLRAPVLPRLRQACSLCKACR